MATINICGISHDVLKSRNAAEYEARTADSQSNRTEAPLGTGAVNDASPPGGLLPIGETGG